MNKINWKRCKKSGCEVITSAEYCPRCRGSLIKKIVSERAGAVKMVNQETGEI